MQVHYDVIDDELRVSVIGGGPGGLKTAYLLQQKVPGCRVTIHEAGPRVGGKIVTKQFSNGVGYEAGLAELYVYRHLGPDALADFVDGLGLDTVPMSGETVVMDDRVIRDAEHFVELYGRRSGEALREFRDRCEALVSPEEYYCGAKLRDPSDPLAQQTWRKFLATIRDRDARRYVEISCHSDIAAEAHQTSAQYGLSNYLMQCPSYLRLRGIRGGNQRIVDKLRQRITATVILNSTVKRVLRKPTGGYQVLSRGNGHTRTTDADVVVLALPNHYLPLIEYDDDLEAAIGRHHVHFDAAASYLRVTLLFQRPYWRGVAPGAYFMVDAFGGSAVYDDGVRIDCGEFGVQGWLLAGNAALTMSRLGDRELVQRVLDSLPAPLARGRALYVEGKVERWQGSVNRRPGGRGRRAASELVPDARNHPDVLLVGDYTSDSTLNGVLESADAATDLIRNRLAARARRGGVVRV